MAVKTRRPRSRASNSTIELIVRRGSSGRFDKLKKKTEHLPVSVVWDRRTTDRRKEAREIEADRRNADRRAHPPFTWDLSDFVVVEREQRAARKVR